MNEGLDLRALAALDALVKAESVSKAARVLGVSQPTMSRILARLREVLGDPLLVRSGHRMMPTPRAIEIAGVARSAIATIDEVVTGTDFDPARSARHFRLAAWDYTQRLLLPPLIRELRHHAPSVSIEIMPVIDRSPVDALEEREIHLSVGLHRGLRDGYRRRGLFHDEFVICAHADHDIWAAPMSAPRFASFPHLLVAPFSATRNGVVDVALRELGMQRTVVAYVTSFAAAPEILREASLVATLPRRLVAHAAPDLKVAPPPIPLPSFEIEAVWHSSLHEDAGHRWFRQLLATAASTIGHPSP